MGGQETSLPEFAAALKASDPAEDLAELAQPAKPRWTGRNRHARRAEPRYSSPYVVDTLTLPFDNPYKALLFVGGHDFFANGDIAICTVHGDVWRVSGVDDKLERLVWKRFATGLFQPLGLKTVDDHVHVLGRDQITRLVDRNADGEADEYQCFTNAYPHVGGRTRLRHVPGNEFAGASFISSTRRRAGARCQGRHEHDRPWPPAFAIPMGCRSARATS